MCIRDRLRDGVPIALHLRAYTLEVEKSGPGGEGAIGRKVRIDGRVATVGTSPDNDNSNNNNNHYIQGPPRISPTRSSSR